MPNLHVLFVLQFMNGPLLNTFWLEEIERLDAMKVHPIAQLHKEHIVLPFEMIGFMQVLLTIETHPLFFR
jgi:hypothetical protein